MHQCILNGIGLVYVQWDRLDRRGIMVMEIKARGLRVAWEWKGCSRYRRYVKDLVRGTRSEEGDEGKTDVRSQETPAKYQGAGFSHVLSRFSFSTDL